MGQKPKSRTCLGCRSIKEKEELFAVVRDKEKKVYFMPPKGVNGRSAYVCKDIKCILKVEKTKAFMRALDCAIPDEIFEEIKKELG